MTKPLHFYFDVVSPASYIAWHVLPKIAAAAGVAITYRPIFLGGIMQATGNRPPGTVGAKGRWMDADLTRWAGLYGLAYRRNAIHPQITLTVMRGALSYRGEALFMPYCTALMQAMHVENREIQDPAVLATILEGIGIEPAGFMARVRDQALKDALKKETEAAVSAGVFGAPSFVVGETLHFGQDRLWMVAEDLGVNLHEAVAEAVP